MPGLPIRTPSDHSPLAGSPRLIAGHHVLHRPLMPRHPPNAHKNKRTTQKQSSTELQPSTHQGLTAEIRDARVHYTVHNQPTHTTKQTTNDRLLEMVGSIGTGIKPISPGCSRTPIACHASKPSIKVTSQNENPPSGLTSVCLLVFRPPTTHR